MGPSIQGLDKLLKLPTGCGEQNMLKFAPNIFIIKYLEATNNIDKTILEKAKDYMETGIYSLRFNCTSLAISKKLD